MINMYIDPYILSPFESSPFFHKVVSFAKDEAHKVAMLGVDSRIPWNVLTYLEEEVRIPLTESYEEFEKAEGSCIFVGAYNKKGLDTLITNKDKLTDLFIIDEQATINDAVLSQLLSSIPHIHYLATEKFYQSAVANNIPKNRPYIFSCYLFHDPKLALATSRLVTGHDELFKALAKTDITIQSFYSPKSYLFIPPEVKEKPVRAKVIDNITSIEELTVEDIKPLEVPTAEPQGTSKSSRLEEIEERLAKSQAVQNNTQNDDKAQDILKFTQETLKIVRKVNDVITNQNQHQEQSNTIDDFSSDYDPLDAFRAQQIN